jgi:hypothetical protein
MSTYYALVSSLIFAVMAAAHPARPLLSAHVGVMGRPCNLWHSDNLGLHAISLTESGN